MAYLHGTKILFGEVNPKPAKGFPAEEVEFCIQACEFVFAKCQGKTYAVKDTGDYWEPAQEIELIQVETELKRADGEILKHHRFEITIPNLY
jgi:hypothetical protein